MGMWEKHGVWHFSADRDEQIRPAAEASTAETPTAR
jgi:hypothetical protein